MRHLILAWYVWLSTLSQGLVVALGEWTERLDLAPGSALLFGLIAAASPCQLTTNLGALAYAARESSRTATFASALAYAAGKVSVYSAAGILIIVAGLQLQAHSVPVVVAARKVLGPLMVLAGLALLGVMRLRGGFGHRLSLKLRAAVPMRGVGGAFLLGVVFSLAFCPTLFWLFFGLTVPLALRSPGGWSLPGLFALGSTLPLLALSGILALGFGALESTVGKLSRVQRIASVAAGTVFVLAGLHDTIVYWWL
jgi:cytochrome c biogenesis protein CcdA